MKTGQSHGTFHNRKRARSGKDERVLHSLKERRAK
jgi:hypothetical protein